MNPQGFDNEGFQEDTGDKVAGNITTTPLPSYRPNNLPKLQTRSDVMIGMESAEESHRESVPRRSRSPRQNQPIELTSDEMVGERTGQSVDNKPQREETQESPCKNCAGKKEFPRAEVKYFCQIFIIFIVVVVCLYNLTAKTGNDTLWTALLGSSIGYLLPNPNIKRKQN